MPRRSPAAARCRGDRAAAAAPRPDRSWTGSGKRPRLSVRWTRRCRPDSRCRVRARACCRASARARQSRTTIRRAAHPGQTPGDAPRYRRARGSPARRACRPAANRGSGDRGCRHGAATAGRAAAVRPAPPRPRWLRNQRRLNSYVVGPSSTNAPQCLSSCIVALLRTARLDSFAPADMNRGAPLSALIYRPQHALWAAGVGTMSEIRRLPRRLRAFPSAGLDEWQ